MVEQHNEPVMDVWNKVMLTVLSVADSKTGSVVEVVAVLRNGHFGIHLSVVQQCEPDLHVAVEHLVGCNGCSIRWVAFWFWRRNWK